MKSKRGALARVPLPGLTALGPLFFFGVPTLLTLITLGYDRLRTGTFNRVLALGALLLIASYPVRLMLARTETWMRFAQWLTTSLCEAAAAIRRRRVFAPFADNHASQTIGTWHA